MYFALREKGDGIKERCVCVCVCVQMKKTFENTLNADERFFTGTLR